MTPVDLLIEYQQMSFSVNVKAARTDCFSTEGVGFTLYFEPTLAPDRLCIRCDVLDLLDERDAQLMTHMLADNLVRYHQRKPVFALEPHSMRVVALLNLSVSETQGDVFEALIREWVLDVKQWRARSEALVSEPNLIRGGKSAR